MVVPYLQDTDFTLYIGDVRDRLRGMAPESVHCVVTSPPYWNQRDYGVEGQLGLEETPEEFVENMVEVFSEVWRVLHPMGTVWLNIGDCYSGQEKNTGVKPKDLIGVPWMLAFALREQGWYLRSEIVWAKPNAMPESVHDRPTCSHEKVFLLAKSKHYYYDKEAVKTEAEWKRWGDQTNAKYNETNNGKAGFIKNKSKKEIYEYVNDPAREHQGGTKNLRNVWNIRTEPFAEAHFATFPQALVEPCIKAGCPERVCMVCGQPSERIMERDGFTDEDSGPRGNYIDDPKIARWSSREEKFAPNRYYNETQTGWTDCAHDLWSPGVVLDPFMGSGTTALVARRLGRRCVGIELNEGYAELIMKRTEQLSLLG